MEKVYTSRIKTLSLAIFCLLTASLFIFGVYESFRDEDYGHFVLFSVLSLFLVSLFAILLYSSIKRERLLLSLDDKGMEGITNVGFIRLHWDDVYCFHLGKGKASKGYIGIVLREAENVENYFSGKPKLVREIAYSDAKYKGSPLVMNVSSGALSAKKIHELLTKSLLNSRIS